PPAPAPWAGLLDARPRAADDLARGAGVALGPALAALELGVLEGWVERVDGHRYRLAATAGVA
ncbi:MAG: hypothetical protein P1P87_11545, partial [Trueperaceae bacterium]|nr:hypothetical protein [Trueperaceae bacterium]